MKKKTLGLLAAVLSVAMLAGCGAKDTGNGTGTATGAGTESTALKDMDVDKYVTLGEYKGLEVSVDTVEVDEDEWDTLVNNVYYGNITAENGGITDRAVETGDTVNIDYEGKKDGVAFDGGTDQGYDLTIGSGQFIAGFEDGLIGVMPGETVDLDLTFPENYGNADLAGQAVVFTVTVNYIQPAQDGEFSDEVISNFGIDGVTNEEELRQYAYDFITEFPILCGLNIIYRHRKYHSLSCKVCISIVLRECKIQIHRLAGHHADQSILKSGNKLSGTDGQIIPLVSATVKCHTVFFAFIINVYSVSGLHGTVCDPTVLCGNVSIIYIIDQSIPLVLIYFHSIYGYFQPLVLAQSHILVHIHILQCGTFRSGAGCCTSAVSCILCSAARQHSYA
jgi:hypothetical protein